jgi:hypothetical protein
VGIRSAQNMPKSTVVYVGSTTSDLFGPTFRTSYTALPTTVADVRDALNKRTINHVACASSLTASFLDDVLLDIPETFSYQIWTDLVRMPGMMLPHEFEIYLGKLMSLSITVRNGARFFYFSWWAHLPRFNDCRNLFFFFLVAIKFFFFPIVPLFFFFFSHTLCLDFCFLDSFFFRFFFSLGQTFVPTPLPNDRYFSYWRSTKDLMNAAARSVQLEVRLLFTVVPLRTNTVGPRCHTV